MQLKNMAALMLSSRCSWAQVVEYVQGLLLPSSSSAPSASSAEDTSGPAPAQQRTLSETRGAARGDEALEEKRVCNALIKSELGVVLRFPTYREGMTAVHAREPSPFRPSDLEFMF